MAPIMSLIKDINMRKSQWTMKLRLVRFYEKPMYNDHSQIQSMECVFHDSEGDRIHGTIRKMHVPQFKKLLSEGNVYVLKDFIVAHYSDKYKTTAVKYKIMFHGKTYVYQLDDNSLPRFMYNFKSFRELSSVDGIDGTMLFDIIGKVTAMQPAQTKEYGGKLTRFIDITLGDLENNRICGTLWEEYVDVILPHLDQHSLEPLIMVLQMCRAKVYRDEVKVSNTYHVTKMILNGDIEEISDFKKRDTRSSHPARSISHVSYHVARSIPEDLASGESPFRLIDQLYANEEVGSFWISATIFSFIGDWWYLSCKKCPKKLTQVGEKIYCERCDKFSHSGNFRYRIQLEVGDDSANAPLLCWDRECEALIGKPCSTLKNELNEKDNWNDIPDELAALVDKKVLFTVQVKVDQIHFFTGAFSIMRLTANPELLKQYSTFGFDSQESDYLSKLQEENSEHVKDDGSSEDEVNTPDKLIKKAEVAGGGSSIKRKLLGDFSSSNNAKVQKKDIKVKVEDEKKI